MFYYEYKDGHYTINYFMLPILTYIEKQIFQ